MPSHKVPLVVPAWLARGQAGVHVDVRLDIRSAQHRSVHVDLLGDLADAHPGRLHRREATVVDQEVDQPLLGGPRAVQAGRCG